ncbi:MAG: c-type cytochrome [Ginsengibacter sp.]
MKSARLKIIVLIFLCACYNFCCSNANNTEETSVAPAPAGLYSVITKLPEAPGYKSFQNNCMSCHSARYVQMQPDLSEKTWLALVAKMQKSFGAPVPDSSVKEIVQYLVAIRGKSSN